MLNENFSFKLLKEEKCARVGKIYTHRGHIDTPTFMTVGTQGTIKAAFVDDVISIGDYVMGGGEIPAMVLIEAISRLIPNVVGDKSSLVEESFECNRLEYPQYTKPREYRGLKVPEVLLSGNHKKIQNWQHKEALKKTAEIRPDLLSKEAEKSDET